MTQEAEPMTARQYLSRAYVLRKRIAAKELHLEELRTQAEHITADLTGMPKGSGAASPVERVAVQIADLSWELEQDWLDVLVYQEEIRKTIDRIEDPVVAQVLSARYISYLTWRKVAETLHYSERAVYKIHRKGLRIVEAFIVVQ